MENFTGQIFLYHRVGPGVRPVNADRADAEGRNECIESLQQGASQSGRLSWPSQGWNGCIGPKRSASCPELVLYLGRQAPLSRPWEEAFFTPSTTGGPPSGRTPPGPRLFIYSKHYANKPSILDMMHSFEVQCIHSTLYLARKVSLTGPWEAFNAFIPPFRIRPVSVTRADPGARPVI